MSRSNHTKNELGALRCFRARLKALGAQYPHLKDPETLERLTATLHQQPEAETSCPENRLEDHGEDHRGVVC